MVRPELNQIYQTLREMPIQDELELPFTKAAQQVLRNHPGDVTSEAQDALIALLVTHVMSLEMRIFALESGDAALTKTLREAARKVGSGGSPQN